MSAGRYFEGTRVWAEGKEDKRKVGHEGEAELRFWEGSRNGTRQPTAVTGPKLIEFD